MLEELYKMRGGLFGGKEETTVETASSAEKIAQLLFPGFRFGSDDPSEAERLVDLGVGGFCLYGGNVSEVFEFTRRLQNRARIPLLFCGDYEDGIFRHVAGGTALPSNMGIGASGLEELAAEKARITAVESKAVGVPWILAPVVDLATCPGNPIVNTRSFGDSPERVSRMARAYARGLKQAGALSCVKHFPGHGETAQDSHLMLPLLRLTRVQLSRRELIPFERTRTAADAVMLAHLYIPALTGGAAGRDMRARRRGQGDTAFSRGKIPASLSAEAVSLLRRDLRYRGLIVTDALSMNAIAMHFKEEKACAAALTAGADILLVPAKPFQAAYALPSLLESAPRLEKQVLESYARLMRMKKACGLFADKGIVPENEPALVGSEEHLVQAERMAAACLTWVNKKDFKLLSGSVRYWEPEAESSDEWQGRVFVEELKALGIDVRPYGSSKEGRVVVASFIRPRAYSGRIELSSEERRRANQVLSASDDSVFVSFGSPFVFDQVRRYQMGLCAFSEIDASQKAAAQALVGRIPAPGRMPVALKVLAA